MSSSINQYPFISIIIPTWREGSVLRTCLDSLAKIDYPPEKMEVFLLSQEKLKVSEYSSARCILLEKGVGYAEARNIGVKEAKGDFVAFLDDDCIIPQDWLVKAFSLFERYPEFSLVGGPALPFQQVTKYTLSSKVKVLSLVSSVVSDSLQPHGLPCS